MREAQYSSLRLEITSKCDLRCAYCHNSDNADNANDMRTNEIIALVRKLKDKYPINKVLLAGGEPLVNKDLLLIIETLSSGLPPPILENICLVLLQSNNCNFLGNHHF